MKATYLETSLLRTSRLVLVDTACTFSLSSFTTFASLVDYFQKRAKNRVSDLLGEMERVGVAYQSSLC